MKDSEEYPETEKIEKFRLVTRLGETILKNGGEIFRADEAMRYAARAYGLEDFHSYVVANGIFSSYCTKQGVYSCRILNTPLSPIVLCKVEALNDLSRKISAGLYPLEKAKEELERIENMHTLGNGVKTLAAAIGAGCFSILFLGSFEDGLGAFLAGLSLEAFLLYIIPAFHLPKIMINIASAMTASFVCCLLYSAGIGDNLDLMMIGPVFILSPGVLITNAIRNLLENDYLTGLLRMMDAFLVAGSIAIGVGVSMQIWQSLTGKIL